MGISKIIICTKCKGTGETHWRDLGHNPDEHTETCSKCKGKGRLFEETYTYHTPLTIDKNKKNAVDKKIVTAIREIEV